MRIGIIGASNIGGTLGTHWVKAGHEVLFGVRRPMALSDLTRRLGAMAKAASPGEAAVFAETLLFAAPYGAWPEFAAENGEDLIDKVVIDAANPYAQRDGAVVEAVARAGRGAAAYTASLLPMSHVTKAFNTIFWKDLRDQAHRSPPRLAIPVVGDHEHALDLTVRLIEEAGFDGLRVAGLQESSLVDPGAPIYGKSLDVSALRHAVSAA